jgi:hypothetical protein
MSPDAVPTFDERDLVAVEERLSALWEQLPPAQQAVLDAIIGAGLALATGEDTSGYFSPLINPETALLLARSRAQDLKEEYQRANPDHDDPPRARRRWDLRPLLAWLRHSPDTVATPRPSGRLSPET